MSAVDWARKTLTTYCRELVHAGLPGADEVAYSRSQACSSGLTVTSVLDTNRRR